MTNNDKALAAFNDWLNSGDEADIALAYHAETIISALSTDAPIVEGLDEALTRYEQDGIIYDDQDHNDRMIEPLYEAARLYAQGRTQSAVPEALRTLDWERDLDLLRAEVVNDVVATLRIDRLHQLIEALSAAPPVTGGALPELFEKCGQCDGDGSYGQQIGPEEFEHVQCEYCLARGFIPYAPPSSAEKEGV